MKTKLGMVLTEARFELKKILRNPGFTLPALGFPVAFFLLFCFVLPMGKNLAQIRLTLLANYACFGAIGAALFGGAVLLAVERDTGVFKLKRISPAAVHWLLLAKLMASAVIALLGFFLLYAVAAVFGVRTGFGSFIGLALISLAAALPFGAIGLAIGARFSATAAPGIVNAFFLAGSALSGLWFPLAMMPKFINLFAPFWPMHALGQLGRQVVGLETCDVTWALARLFIWALIGLVFASIALKRKPF
jgi:ABC-2 type transport system permease protein